MFHRRRRYQTGSVVKCRKHWMGLWYAADGRRKSRILGKVREMTKGEARKEFDVFMMAVRASNQESQRTLGEFTVGHYLPFAERRWKASTASTTRNRIESHIVRELGELPMARANRTRLQDWLDSKPMLSHSVLKHLRWDLNAIFNLAVSDGVLNSNPASELAVPAGQRAAKYIMSLDEVRKMREVLPLRERLVCELATLVGMRPGEIFGLRWHHYQGDRVIVDQRIYHGELGTPKTLKGIREAALGELVRSSFESWKVACGELVGQDGWLFPSEEVRTPIEHWNLFRRSIRPRLKGVGLGWVSFQVMRRTHASLMKEFGADDKVIADQLGHNVDVDVNVYQQTSVEHRRKALDKLESALNGLKTD